MGRSNSPVSIGCFVKPVWSCCFIAELGKMTFAPRVYLLAAPINDERYAFKSLKA